MDLTDEERAMLSADELYFYDSVLLSSRVSGDESMAFQALRDLARTRLALQRAKYERDEARAQIAACVFADPRQLWNVAAGELAKECKRLRDERDALRAQVEALKDKP